MAFPCEFRKGDFYVVKSETWDSNGVRYEYYRVRKEIKPGGPYHNLDTALTILEAVSKTIHLHEQEMQGHE